jgi:hypothetical protein
VFAALRGALFAIGDEELLEWKHRFGVFHPFRIPSLADDRRPTTEDRSGRTSDAGLRTSDVGPRTSNLAHLQPIADSLRLLQQLHRRRNYRPVAETIQELLDATRAHVGIVLRSAGEQALANVLHVAELAREYEAAGGLSFRGFVDELRIAAETAQAGEAPILEEGSDGVRMMTVHKAKGLEFPVVVLADLTCKLSRAEAGPLARRGQRQVRAEDRRLGADRPAAARRRGSGARPRRVGAARVCRRDARPRSAGHPGRRRWPVRRRLARPADPVDLSARERAPSSEARRRRARLQVEGHAAQSSRGGSGDAADRGPGDVRVRSRAGHAQGVFGDLVGSPRACI